MRYYNIVITDPAGKLPAQQYTSFPNGKTDPGALNVEIDIFSLNMATTGKGSFVRIWGIPLTAISQAANLVGMNITVSAGMQKGLPLANPAQSGIIGQGQIYQAFGNWIGLDQTLDIYMLAPTGTGANPMKFSFNWRAGSSLASALQTTLATALPKLTPNININPNLVLGHDVPGYYNSLDEFAQWLKPFTASIIGGSYKGVDISVSQSQISAHDGTKQTTPIAISFLDLIGQPTWIESPNIQLKTVMRADIGPSAFITIPNTVATATPGSVIGTQARNKASFQGAFQVSLVRHVGNFRQPDAASWVSIITAYPTQQNLQTGGLAA
jgi:hypothetical protein